MGRQKNNKGVTTLLIIIIVTLSILCVLFATETISFNDKEVKNNSNNKNNTEINDTSNSNVIVTKNGKLISNEIPSDLIGKYVNKNSNESYIQLTNNSIEVSEPTGGGAPNIFKNDQVKLYINFLNVGVNLEQYVTIEFYIENNGYNQKTTYIYIGEKSSHDNEYHFKTPYPTPAGGEGNNNNDYPYSK